MQFPFGVKKLPPLTLGFGAGQIRSQATAAARSITTQANAEIEPQFDTRSSNLSLNEIAKMLITMFDVHDAVRCATSPSSIPEGCLNVDADHGLTSGGNDRVIIVIFSFGVELKTRPYAGLLGPTV
uniref:Uncharacterized protein n=1 Tax=Anopheles merus TaxID=30066 RepID=A0A182V2W7_ANOME